TGAHATSLTSASTPPTVAAVYLSTLLPSLAIENEPLGPAIGNRSHDPAPASKSSLNISANTRTAQVAVNPPSCEVAVITAWPGPIARTVPLSSTLATEGALLLQITPRSVALAGDSVAVSVRNVATVVSSRSVPADSAMPVTGTTVCDTV